MFRLVLALSLATLAAPSIAADPTSGTDAQPAKEKKICRRETGTGSIMPKMVCRTKAEWAALTAKSEGVADVARDRQETSTQTQGMLNGN